MTLSEFSRRFVPVNVMTMAAWLSDSGGKRPPMWTDINYVLYLPVGDDSTVTAAQIINDPYQPRPPR